MKEFFNFKLHEYNSEYYRIYDKALEVDLNQIPSFRLLKKYLDVKSGEFILDAGCGIGHLLNYLICGTGALGFGIDFSEAALARAQKKYPLSRYSRQDLKEIGFKASFFDKIVCFNVIEHIAEQANVMHEFRRILKPGGFLIIGTNIRDSVAWRLYQLCIGEKTHIREFSVQEFLDFLGQYFEIVNYKKSSGFFRFGPPLSWIFHYIFHGDILALCRKII